MLTIWEMPLNPDRPTELILPGGASILGVFCDKGIKLSILVDPAKPTAERVFINFSAGEKFDTDGDLFFAGMVDVPMNLGRVYVFEVLK